MNAQKVMEMKNNEHHNLFSWYLDIIKYNIKSLNRLVEANEFFLDIVKKSLTNGFPKNDFKSLELEGDNDAEITKDRTIENSLEIPDELEIYNMGMIIPQTNLEDLEDMYDSMMDNRPITTLKNLSTEHADILNLYGIRTIQDLEEKNITEISRDTGISKTWLYNLRRQIP
jgi:hypothetical protein